MRCLHLVVVFIASAIVLLPSGQAMAVGGISGAKLAAPNTETVAQGRMEFEPYFGVAYSTQEFDARARIVGTGYRDQSFETGFRFTAGITSSLEAGLVLPILFNRSLDRASDLEAGSNGIGDIPVGLKWRFFKGKRVGLALAAGATFPSGSHRAGESDVPLGEGTYVPEVGFITTVELYRNLSMDLHVGYGTAFHKSGDVASMGAVFDVAVGYAIGSFQPVIELAQSVGGWDGVVAYELALLGGFTWELSKSVIVVTGVRVPLVGRSAARELGFSLAFTILL